MNYSQNLQTLRKHSKEKILELVKDSKDLYFLSAWGNIGDDLIYSGTKVLLRDLKYKEINLRFLKNETGDTALISGSGGWTRHFHKLPTYLAKVERQFNQVIVLPSTYDVSVPYIRQIISESNAKFFARDIISFNNIMNLCNADIALDFAFFFDFEPFKNDQAKGILNAFRTDAASIWKELPIDNTDISLICKTQDEWLTKIAKHKTIRTDRAHVMIAAAMLEKHVEYTITCDHKLPSIAEYAFKDFPVYRILDPQTHLHIPANILKKTEFNKPPHKDDNNATIIEQFAKHISDNAEKPLYRFQTWKDFLATNTEISDPVLIIDEGIYGIKKLGPSAEKLRDIINKIFKIILLDDIQAFPNLTELKSVTEEYFLPLEFSGIIRTRNGRKAYISILSSSLPQDFLPPPKSFKTTAIISTYNEGDIIEETIDYLVQNQVNVYLIDNWSTDKTYEIVKQIKSEYLIGVERWPEPGPSNVYNLKEILKRKETLAEDIDSDWFINHDVDEIRESPWKGINLHEGFWVVDQQGFNAVDFTVLNFPPIDNGYESGSPFLNYFEHFEFGTNPGHFKQVKAWKKGMGRPNLHISSGHNVTFEGRKIFPYKFLLRHYPIRSQQHGEKKVFNERKFRYNPEELQKGWHTHYADISYGYDFLKPDIGLLHFCEPFYSEFIVERLSGIGIPDHKETSRGNDEQIKYYHSNQMRKNETNIIMENDNVNQHSPILICGMHRSGTSLITQILNACGLYLGQENELMAAHPEDNPAGYWEYEPIVTFTDHLMAKVQGAWNNPTPFFAKFWLHDIDLKNEMVRARNILKPLMNSGNNWGWKDPRSTIMLPFWKSLYPNLKIIVCLRNPLEVAFSLSKRQNTHIDFDQGLVLWRDYYEILKRDLNGIDATVTHYESMFFDPIKEIHRLANFALLNPDNKEITAAKQMIKSRLYRGVATEEALEHFDRLPLGLLELYQKFANQAGEVYSDLQANQIANTDRFKFALDKMLKTSTNRFDKFNRIIRSIEIEKHVQETHLNNLIEQQKFQLAKKENIIQTFQHELSKKDISIQTHQHQLSKKDNSIQTLQHQLSKKDNSIKTFQHELYKKDNSIQTLQHQLSKKDNSIQTLQHQLLEKEQEILFYALSKSWRLTRPLRKLMRVFNKQIK